MVIVPFLRDGPDTDPAIWQQIERLQAMVAAADKASGQTPLLGQIGDLYRAAGAYAEAIAILADAVDLARHQRDERRVVANLIRLATARQYHGEHATAATLFHEALALTQAPDCQDYTDFVWQHLGKCLVEQEQFTDALHCFEHAHELRVTKHNAALLASTENAIAATRERWRARSA